MSLLVMFQLTESDKLLLLQIARSSVRAHLSGEVFELTEVPAASLTEISGVFVSIHKNGELRGCIGRIEASEPLYRSAADCAVSAAFSDPRFSPLTGEELPLVDFEISV